jgi:alanine racemase
MHWHSVLEINLNTIKENYKKLKELSSSEVSAAVKANAYGLGATQVASALAQEGCKKFFVANLAEGISLRETLKSEEIFVLNGIFKSEEEYFIQHNLIPVLSDHSQISDLNEYCAKNEFNFDVALHFETGMNRFGIKTSNFELFFTEIQNCKNLNIKYIISHLACSDQKDNELNLIQLNRFREIKSYFKNSKFSLANSGGILLGSDYHFDFVRAGAAIYGINVRKDMSFFSNPIRLFSPLIQIKKMHQGEGLGYNQTFMSDKTHLVGTIAIGYADGISRALSNKGKCYIKGFEAKIIGRVSMDLINIDLSNIPKEHLFLGQEVDIINNTQTPDKIAESIGTIGYEITTSLGNRYERIYIR